MKHDENYDGKKGFKASKKETWTIMSNDHSIVSEADNRKNENDHNRTQST